MECVNWRRRGWIDHYIDAVDRRVHASFSKFLNTPEGRLIPMPALHAFVYGKLN